MREILTYKTDGSVLDLGSSSGRHSLFLVEHGFKVTAVDKNQDALEQLRQAAAREGAAVETVHSSAESYHPLGCFDVVIATMLLHFLTPEDIPRVVSTIQDCTNKDGLNVISVLTRKNRRITRPHLFARGELRSFYGHSWTTLHYEEQMSAPFPSRAIGKLITQHRAVLIARKSSPCVNSSRVSVSAANNAQLEMR